MERMIGQKIEHPLISDQPCSKGVSPTLCSLCAEDALDAICSSDSSNFSCSSPSSLSDVNSTLDDFPSFSLFDSQEDLCDENFLEDLDFSSFECFFVSKLFMFLILKYKIFAATEPQQYHQLNKNILLNSNARKTLTRQSKGKSEY